MANKPVDYQALSQELETILADLQQADGDVASSMAQYERGLVIIKQLEAQVSAAETKVSKLQAQFSDPA